MAKDGKLLSPFGGRRGGSTGSGILCTIIICL
jgi:hypothetical protein